MKTIKELWTDYIDIIDTMQEMRGLTGATLYSLDNKRSKIHGQLNEYYKKTIGNYAGGFDPERLKSYTDNLDKLIERIDTFNWGGTIPQKIALFFDSQYGSILLSNSSKEDAIWINPFIN